MPCPHNMEWWNDGMVTRQIDANRPYTQRPFCGDLDAGSTRWRAHANAPHQWPHGISSTTPAETF